MFGSLPVHDSLNPVQSPFHVAGKPRSHLRTNESPILLEN